MAYQQDIRVTKTHKALAEALAALSEKKPFQKITVNDICQAAMVSRSTFYLHFEDKYQLMRFCMQQEHERMLSIREADEDPRAFFRKVFLAAKERKNVYYNFFTADANHELNHMFRSFFHNCMVAFINESKEQGAELDGPVSILAAYYSSGLAGMMMQWIEEDFCYSVEEMTLCLYNLVSALLPD